MNLCDGQNEFIGLTRSENRNRDSDSILLSYFIGKPTISREVVHMIT